MSWAGVLEASLLASVPNLRHGFSTKALSKEAFALLSQKTRFVHQVHGDALFWLDGILPDPRPQADALATQLPSTAIGIYTGDCVPVLAAALAESGTALGVLAVHAGWRGSAARIAEKALSLFSARFPGSRIYAAIGPCISRKAFVVSDDVIQAFPGCLEDGRAEFFREEDGRRKYLFDLPRENRLQLEKAALKAGIELECDILPRCTVLEAEHFHSYRRDKEKAGRNLSWIALR